MKNIEMHQGETALIEVTVTDVEGSVVDLTGYDIRYEALTTPKIVKDIDDGMIACADPQTGVFTFTITAEDTASLDISGVRSFAHECRVQGPTGVQVIFTGRLLIAEALIKQMDPTL